MDIMRGRVAAVLCDGPADILILSTKESPLNLLVLAGSLVHGLCFSLLSSTSIIQML